MRSPFFQFFVLLAFTLLFSCEDRPNDEAYRHMDRRDRIRLMQYLQEGRRLYALHCANCHQPDGKGLARLYPPLKNSDYLRNNTLGVLCGIKYGQKGPITVNGIEFNQIMPPVANITDLEIAEIATFIYTEFADTARIITMNEVRALLEQCNAGDSLKIKK